MLNEFGKLVRKARIDIGVTMMQMANDLTTTPSFLSAMETGRKKVPLEWVGKIEEYFAKRNHPLSLGGAADAANKEVSLDGLSVEHQMLVSGFARVQSSSLTTEDVMAFSELLKKIGAK